MKLDAQKGVGRHWGHSDGFGTGRLACSGNASFWKASSKTISKDLDGLNGHSARPSALHTGTIHWSILKPLKTIQNAVTRPQLFAQSWNSVILLCALKLLFQAVRICWHNQVYFRDLAKSSTMFQCKLSLNSLDPFIAFRDIAQLLGIHRTNPINLKDYIVFKVQGPNCYSKGGSTQDVCIGKSLNLSRVIAWLVSLLWISAKHAVWLFNWLPHVYWICSDVAFLDISGVLMRLGPENLILCSKMLRQKIWLGSELKLQIASPEWSSVSSKRKTARWINFWFATFGQSAKNWRSNDREMVWA